MPGPEPSSHTRPPLSNAPRRPVDLKRFTVRDGFHLKDRNDEQRVEIDRAIAITDSSHGTDTCNQTSDAIPTGPTSPGDVATPSVDMEIAKIFGFLQRPAPQLADSGGSPPAFRTISAGADAGTENNSSEDAVSPLSSSLRQSETVVVHSRLQPSSDWLIYRHRTNATPRRKEQQLEKMIHDVLDHSAKTHDVLLLPANTTNTTPETDKRIRRHQRPRDDETTYPRQQLLRLHSIGPGQSVVNGRRFNAAAGLGYRQELVGKSADGRAAAPVTPTTATTPRFATQRSLMREKTAMAFKADKLLGRLHELRSFPAVLERVLQLEKTKHHERILLHGEDLVQKNKRHLRHVTPLQRPPHTPVFPSLVDHKHHRALQRKQLVDADQESTLQRVVNRWQNRRVEIQQHGQRQYVQSQWLLLAALGRATARWRDAFREIKTRRDAIVQLAMVKKIQRRWRQHVYLRRNNPSRTLPVDSLLRGVFYKMPSVLKAIHVVQVGMRRWLAGRRKRAHTRHVEIIITSWLEFQDVKFRRLILRFRKRVREFQTMWRTWRAITDARIKLLLLVWTRAEKRHRRRMGVATPQQQQQQDDAGRHFRNGGMVLSAISATTPSRSPVKNDAMRDFQTMSPHAKTSLPPSRRDTASASVLPATSPHHHHHHHTTSMVRSSRSTTRMEPWRPPSSPPAAEKIPLSLKTALLRQLLSEKRKQFQATKDRKRTEWKQRHQQLRRIDFQHNVLDELAAFQRFQAEHAVLLVLRSVSDADIVQLIQTAHQRLSVSSNPHTSSAASSPFPFLESFNSPASSPASSSSPVKLSLTTKVPSTRALTPSAPSELHSKPRYDGPRRSTVMTIKPPRSRQQSTIGETSRPNDDDDDAD